MNAVGKRARKTLGDGGLSRYAVARARRKKRRQGLSRYQARKLRAHRARGLLVGEAPGFVDAMDLVRESVENGKRNTA